MRKYEVEVVRITRTTVDVKAESREAAIEELTEQIDCQDGPLWEAWLDKVAADMADEDWRFN